MATLYCIAAPPIVERTGTELPQPFPRSGVSADRRKLFPAFPDDGALPETPLRRQS